jgi:transcriptional regulator with XRE-family HTH domain
MKRTEWLQETRRMRFEEAYEGWRVRRLTQEEAARLLGVHERTFRRYIDRYEEGGVEGLIDKRLSQVSHRRAIAHLLTCDLLDDLLLRLLCNLVGANRQSPVGPDEMAGVAVGIPLEIILMLGFGLPEVACRNDFRNDLARPQA